MRALGAGPVRDIGLLNSAVAGPVDCLRPGCLSHARAQGHGVAALSIARNHSMVDGNKRLAWLATAVFLDLSGREPDLSYDDAFDLVMDVAQGSAEIAEIAERLRVTE